MLLPTLLAVVPSLESVSCSRRECRGDGVFFLEKEAKIKGISYSFTSLLTILSLFLLLFLSATLSLSLDEVCCFCNHYLPSSFPLFADASRRTSPHLATSAPPLFSLLVPRLLHASFGFCFLALFSFHFLFPFLLSFRHALPLALHVARCTHAQRHRPACVRRSFLKACSSRDKS